MKTSIRELPKSKIEISFEVSAKDFNRFIEEAILSLGKDIEIEGFRKGKAPKEILEERLGPEKILNTAAQRAMEESYKKVIFENNLEPISKPNVEILKIPAPYRAGGSGAGAKDNPFSFRIKVFVIPKISLPDYKKIASEIKKEEVSVSEKEIDDTVFQLQKLRAKFIPLARPAQIGDFVEIEYTLSTEDKMGNEKFKDGFLLGKGDFIPGFEEKLEGMTKEEEKEFSLIFPENPPKKDLANRKVNFKVKMLDVKKMELPEISDSFAQNVGKFKTMSDLRRSIKEGLKEEKIFTQEEKRKSEILEKIVKLCFFEVPEILVFAEKEKLFEDFKKEIKHSLKISFEEYLNRVKKDKKEIEDNLLKVSQKRVKNFLILREIGKKEKIFVTDEEIEDRMKEINKGLASQNPPKFFYEKFRRTDGLDLEKLKDYYRSIIFTEKVLKVFVREDEPKAKSER